MSTVNDPTLIHLIFSCFDFLFKKIIPKMFIFLTVPGPPEQIKALAMTSDSIMVAWTRPLEPNGNIIKYNVYYHSLLRKVSFRIFLQKAQDILRCSA